MQNLLFTIAFILTHLLLFIPFKRMISLDKIDNDFLFIYLSNIILLIGFFYFFILASNFLFSFFISLFLMIFSYLLIYHIKNTLGQYQIFSLPYFFLSVYIFAKILIITLF